MLGIDLGVTRRSGGGTFSPLSLDPVLWLDADMSPLWQDAARTTPATADLDPVGACDDLSVWGRHATQATAGLRPLLRLGLQNDRRVLRFDGVDDLLATPAFQAFPGMRGTVFAVMRHTTALADVVGTYATGSPIWLMYSATSSTAFKWYDGVGNKTGAALDPSNAWFQRAAVRDGDTTLKSYLNGALADSFTLANNQPNSNAVYVGAGSNGVNPMNGDLAALIILPYAAGDADLQRFAIYAKARWGLP